MIKEKSPIQKYSSSGFTLLEVSIALTIGSLMVLMGIPLIKGWMAQATVSAGQQRMSAIHQALDNYETQHGRLPCPSSFFPGGPNYEHEIVPPPAPCAIGAGTFPAVGRTGPIVPSPDGTSSVTNPPIIIGALPVRDLGLPESYMADSYENMYTYAVPIYETSVPKYSPTGAIEVVDKNATDVTPPPPSGATKGTATYVVVDHGADGKGAYTLTGTLTKIACNGTAGLDNDNCNLYGSNHFRTASFNQQVGGNWFDDMIVYGVGNSAGNNTAPPPSAAVCTTIYNGVSGAGGSPGHYKQGFDSGWFMAASSLAGFFFFWNTLAVNIGPVNWIPSVTASPTADAYCIDKTYNAVSGGCTQTLGGPAPGGGGVTNAYGGGVVLGGIIPAPYFDYEHLIFAKPRYSQIVPPPMGHPSAGTNALGGPGWECNGSSAAGMQVQAYVVCCPNGG